MGLFPASDLQNVNKKLTNMQNDLNERGLNILKLGFDIKQDGTNTSDALQSALNYCTDNGVAAVIPKGIYTVGVPTTANTFSSCVHIPDGLTVYIDDGARFVLYPDSPAWTRVISIGNNVNVYGELNIDGQCNTITSGNEHMAGLFIQGCKNIYIESVVSKNCYGDNVQLTGDPTSLCENILIDSIIAEKAGRKNLVLEGVTSSKIGYAYLDNTTGNVDGGWGGGNSLDVEPYNIDVLTTSLKWCNQIDYLETFGNGNDISAGTTDLQADHFILNVGTYVQNGGTLEMYSITMNIENAIFRNGDSTIVNAIYAIYKTKLNIKNVKCFDYERLIESRSVNSNSPVLHFGTCEIIGGTSTPTAYAAIELYGVDAYIDHIISKNASNVLMYLQYTDAHSHIHINKLSSYNSGKASDAIVAIEPLGEGMGHLSINSIYVEDSRDEPSSIIFKLYNQTIAQNLTINNIQNISNLTLFRYMVPWFNPAIKLAGIDQGVGIYLLNQSPIDYLAAPPGSLVINTEGGSNSTLFVKESGTDTSGWVAK